MTVAEQASDSHLQRLAQAVQESLSAPAARDGVLLLTGQGPSGDRVELVYDERVATVSLGALAGHARAHSLDGEGVVDAVRAWYNARPVCDAEAAARGIAVLCEGNDGQFGWQACVSRDGVAVPWAPSPWLTGTAITRIRRTCTWRSGLVVAAPVRQGNTAVWHAIPQEVGTAVLTNPARMVEQMRQVGLHALDPCAVVSSAGTVVATERSAANRLAEQVSAPVVHVLPLREPLQFQWR